MRACVSRPQPGVLLQLSELRVRLESTSAASELRRRRQHPAQDALPFGRLVLGQPVTVRDRIDGALDRVRCELVSNRLQVRFPVLRVPWGRAAPQSLPVCVNGRLSPAGAEVPAYADAVGLAGRWCRSPVDVAHPGPDSDAEVCGDLVGCHEWVVGWHSFMVHAGM
jgi:hypothetical protein